jgi:hypothetical protein
VDRIVAAFADLEACGAPAVGEQVNNQQIAPGSIDLSFEQMCDEGATFAAASQQLVFDPQAIAGELTSSAHAPADASSAAFGQAVNSLGFSFELTEPADIVVRGLAQAEGDASPACSFALMGPQSELYRVDLANPAPGAPATPPLDFAASLAPGVYTLLASTTTAVGVAVPPDRSGFASMDFLLGVTVCFGDLDGDGGVGLADLSLILARFGSTGASFAEGDFDLDGDIDLTDLSILLAEFGAVCN